MIDWYLSHGVPLAFQTHTWHAFSKSVTCYGTRFCLKNIIYYIFQSYDKIIMYRSLPMKLPVCRNGRFELEYICYLTWNSIMKLILIWINFSHLFKEERKEPATQIPYHYLSYFTFLESPNKRCLLVEIRKHTAA